MKRLTAAALAACTLLFTSTPLLAADLSPEEIVRRHTSAGGDIDKIMADYADDAVVFQQGRAIQGKPAIRELFEHMFPKRPAGATPPAPPSSSAKSGDGSSGGGMHVTRVWQEGDVGFMTWEAGPMHATEQFLVHDGKIVLQAIFMDRAAPPSAKG